MIELQGLRKTYSDGKSALRGLDLEIDSGLLGLLGPNGAGKTTLLSILVLALEPTAGHCRYDGLDPRRNRDRARIRRRIGYLPQDFSPIRELTGLEYLVHCASLRGVPHGGRRIERRAFELLEAVDLTSVARRRSGEYSGGMRRRLGIAQALIHAPTLVVVDEPTAGLDPEERIRFRNLITGVAEETSVLLSTHVVEDIEATCPRIVVVADGTKQFDGDPGDLIRAVSGKLWELPEDRVSPDARTVSRRVGEGGRILSLVLADEAPDGSVASSPSLEQAYSAFLLQRGFRASDEESA